jgi:beta-lysine 5,6-aminomutase beta subunit
MSDQPQSSPAQPGPAQPGPAQPGPAQLVRPYGDTTGDGRVQVSFTLPVPFGSSTERARAEGAALQLAAKMGLEPAMVVHAKGMGPAFTFFIVYGRVAHLVDLSEVVVAEREFPLLTSAEVNLRIRSGLGRKLVVVGACIGTDAHTVGIDAILNVKGHAGEKGLEYYREIRVVNLGSQVEVERLVARAKAEGADAVLVSQVVTQRDAHIANAREMSRAFDEAGPGRPLLVVGGPRYDPASTGSLGVDKVFGKGTTPREVASYLAYSLTPPPPATQESGDAGNGIANNGAAESSSAAESSAAESSAAESSAAESSAPDSSAAESGTPAGPATAHGSPHRARIGTSA